TRAAAQTTLGGEEDIFLSKLLPDGSDFIYSTYLGSSYSDVNRGWPHQFGADATTLDDGSLAVTPDGRAFISGLTSGADFPLKDPIKGNNNIYSFDGIAALYEPDGTMVY